MKDSTGIELTRGDLVMITIDTPVERPADLIIYLSFEEYVHTITDDGQERTETTTTVHYYPLLKEGVEVAKYDNGVSQSLAHREQKYTIKNIESRHLLKMDPLTLRGYSKTLYDQIQNEL